ncbi:MAG: hypothetical protein ACI32O_01650 [Enterococcus sp.]
MTELKLAIYNKEGRLKKHLQGEEENEKDLMVIGKDLVHLAMRKFSYEEGDQVVIETDQPGSYLMVKLDETLDTSLIYLPGMKWIYEISYSPKRMKARPETRFAGKRHYLSVRVASKEEVGTYRNLALNPHDQKEDTGAYPYAFANVETRNDATFFACNAIDGIYANHSHGSYPFQSWGINQQADATMTIDFGREVLLDKVVFTWRADFPHDSYWEKVTLYFEDGTASTFSTKKTAAPQSFSFAPIKTRRVVFGDLIQGSDPSPFPALTQIELWGKNNEPS